MENFKLYKIKCITNMHVGNGDSSYSIIDNQVQRDVVTNFPTINSSSLKGSLRCFLENNEDNEILQSDIEKIFGSENGIGLYKIFPAMLLSIPVRSNTRQFYRAICPRIIEDLINFIEAFNDKLKLKIYLENILNEINKNNAEAYLFTSKEEKICVEGYELSAKNISIDNKERIEEIFGQDLVVIKDDKFKEIVEELPIIARNQLENGESKNLWYEEIVPRETRFYFGVMESELENQQLKRTFHKIQEKVVQIGGNATIGYGYCDIEEI